MEPKAGVTDFLALVRQRERGKLKLYIGSAAPGAGANSGGVIVFFWACKGTARESVPRSNAQRLVRMSVTVALIAGRTPGHMTAIRRSRIF